MVHDSCSLASHELLETEMKHQQPYSTLSHWVYLRLTVTQYAGSETGVGRNTEKQLNDDLLLDILRYLLVSFVSNDTLCQ